MTPEGLVKCELGHRGGEKQETRSKRLETRDQKRETRNKSREARTQRNVTRALEWD